MLLFVLVFALGLIQCESRERKASLVILPPLVLGYDELSVERDDFPAALRKPPPYQTNAEAQRTKEEAYNIPEIKQYRPPQIIYENPPPDQPATKHHNVGGWLARKIKEEADKVPEIKQYRPPEIISEKPPPDQPATSAEAQSTEEEADEEPEIKQDRPPEIISEKPPPDQPGTNTEAQSTEEEADEEPEIKQDKPPEIISEKPPADQPAINAEAQRPKEEADEVPEIKQDKRPEIMSEKPPQKIPEKVLQRKLGKLSEKALSVKSIVNRPKREPTLKPPVKKGKPLKKVARNNEKKNIKKGR